ncbi:MAG: M13-type metalloendopeptidase, partial [Acetanaerobacterium sp.]
RPADPDAWGMYSHTVNAYYSLSNNEIVFPAAILQAPFYDADAPIEENLGGIGSIIAHELSHAFDNNGALFDENGNYANWWTDADLTAYENKTYALVTQFDEIELASGEYINGELTLGENIADLGGLSCVVQVAKDQGGDLDTLFRAYARAWRCKSTPEYTSYLLKTDTHSPNKYRVNQVLRNIDEFYEVYGIQEDDGMYLAPEDRVRIW